VRTSIQSIRAVRIAVVLRSSVEEKQTTPQVSPASLVLFPDLPVADQVTINLTTAQRNFRYRIVETIVPIMNL
jgi:type IV pilus assembly protein PilW